MRANGAEHNRAPFPNLRRSRACRRIPQAPPADTLRLPVGSLRNSPTSNHRAARNAERVHGFAPASRSNRVEETPCFASVATGKRKSDKTRGHDRCEKDEMCVLRRGRVASTIRNCFRALPPSDKGEYPSSAPISA